jgi:hypothetical protein
MEHACYNGASVSGLQNPTFQQNKARLYTAAIIRQFFDRIYITLLP